MSVFLVNLSARATSHDYAPFWKALRDANAQQLLDAQWMIDVRQDLKTVTDALLSHCVRGDGLFVIELAPDVRWTATGLDETEKSWFGEHVQAARVQAQTASIDPAPAAPLPKPAETPVERRHYH